LRSSLSLTGPRGAECMLQINAPALLLPTDLPAPPIYSKVNPADAPVLTLA